MDLILSTLLGYLLGSFPSGVIVGRWLAGQDPRQHGSGHTGGLNVYRLGGLLPFLLTGAGDVGKGILAVWLAGRFFGPELIGIRPGLVGIHPELVEGWAVPLAGAAAVAGHCWSVWLGFRGGMGVGTGIGAFLLVHPWSIPMAVGAWVVLRLVIRHTPRAMMAALVALPTLQFALGAPWGARALGVLVAGVMFARHVGEWDRVYGSDGRSG